MNKEELEKQIALAVREHQDHQIRCNHCLEVIMKANDKKNFPDVNRPSLHSEYCQIAQDSLAKIGGLSEQAEEIIRAERKTQLETHLL